MFVHELFTLASCKCLFSQKLTHSPVLNTSVPRGIWRQHGCQGDCWGQHAGVSIWTFAPLPQVTLLQHQGVSSALHQHLRGCKAEGNCAGVPGSGGGGRGFGGTGCYCPRPLSGLILPSVLPPPHPLRLPKNTHLQLVLQER